MLPPPRPCGSTLGWNREHCAHSGLFLCCDFSCPWSSPLLVKVTPPPSLLSSSTLPPFSHPPSLSPQSEMFIGHKFPDHFYTAWKTNLHSVRLPGLFRLLNYRAGECCSMAEHLSRTHKAQGSIPNSGWGKSKLHQPIFHNSHLI